MDCADRCSYSLTTTVCCFVCRYNISQEAMASTGTSFPIRPYSVEITAQLPVLSLQQPQPPAEWVRRSLLCHVCQVLEYLILAMLGPALMCSSCCFQIDNLALQTDCCHICPCQPECHGQRFCHHNSGASPILLIVTEELNVLYSRAD